MKRKLIPILLTGALLLAPAGCAGDGGGTPASPDVTPVVSPASSAQPEDASELVGVLTEVKDFMFVLETDDGSSYPFPYAEGEGVKRSELKEGERVKVTYTGTASAVDPFDGAILSVEPVQ